MSCATVLRNSTLSVSVLMSSDSSEFGSYLTRRHDEETKTPEITIKRRLRKQPTLDRAVKETPTEAETAIAKNEDRGNGSKHEQRSSEPFDEPVENISHQLKVGRSKIVHRDQTRVPERLHALDKVCSAGGARVGM